MFLAFLNVKNLDYQGKNHRENKITCLTVHSDSSQRQQYLNQIILQHCSFCCDLDACHMMSPYSFPNQVQNKSIALFFIEKVSSENIITACYDVKYSCDYTHILGNTDISKQTLSIIILSPVNLFVL